MLENVVFEEHTREVDYSDKSVTGMNPKEKHTYCSFNKLQRKKDSFESLTLNAAWPLFQTERMQCVLVLLVTWFNS